MGIFGRMKKEYRAVRIMKILGATEGPDAFMRRIKSGQDSPQVKAEEDMYDLICGESEAAAVMAKHGIVRDDLREIYRRLIMAGAGQWARNTWVAAGAIIDHKALDYVLEQTNYNKPGDDNGNRWMEVAYHLINLYQRS